VIPGASAAGLPERQRVAWRPRVDAHRLRRDDRWWTLTTLAHTLPFILAAVGLVGVRPILAPLGLVLLAHAYAIPALYANRGAGVLRPRTRLQDRAEARALLLLGDLVDDANRELHARTGVVLQGGELGTWVVGEAGALLVRHGARRVNCYCVRVTGEPLPHGDRIAHLLLALRCDEADFATVANVAFSGAAWRVRRRLLADQRPALDAARQRERAVQQRGPGFTAAG
jgi:hypothetical protein